MWIAVNTHANAESLAVANLRRQRYECYCPTYPAQRRHARKVENVRRPLFPGYVFVDVDSRDGIWRPIMSTVGVRAVVKFGDILDLELLEHGNLRGLVCNRLPRGQRGREHNLA